MGKKKTSATVSRQSLLQQIRSALGPAVRPNLTRRSAANDLYEAYLFAIVLDAARRRGASWPPRFKDVYGNAPTTTFVFRTAPGHICSTRRNYCYAEIDFPGKRSLELHQGVYLGGKSKVEHEADVCVLLHTEAETCRQNSNAIPRQSKVVLNIEAKLYQRSRIGIGLGRGFLGLTVEFSKDSSVFASNDSSDSVEKMLTKHKARFEHAVRPGNQVAVDGLRAKVEDVFRQFIAKP